MKILKVFLVLTVIILVNFDISFGKNKTAPKFELQSENDTVVSLEDLKGKPTLLVFFSSTCHTCKKELPLLSKFKQKYKDKVNFYAIVIDTDDKSRIDEIKKEWKFNIPVLFGDSIVMRKYNIFGVPIAYLLTPDLKVYTKYIGMVNPADLDRDLKILLSPLFKK